MSYSQRQRKAMGPARTPCRYEYWWRARRSDQQRGTSPVRSKALAGDRPPPVFDPDQFRLIDPPRRIADLEKALQHSQSDSSLRSTTALLEKPQSIPPEHYHPAIRRLRYGLFAVYQRLFTLIVLLNLAAALTLLHISSWDSYRAFPLSTLATLASANFLLAILFRQDWLVSLLFRTAWLVPWSWPLRVRRLVSRVYCYGGIHSGAAVAGTGWWVVFSGVMSAEGVARGRYTPVLLVLALVIASLLVVIVVLSLPGVRARHHNTWELTHRVLGWASVALLWAQMLLLTKYAADESGDERSFTYFLARSPALYFLAALTALLIYPWLRLQRWTFTATPLSNHALQLSFPNKVRKYSCLVLSTSPLREWHPFATFPCSSTADSTADSSTSPTPPSTSLIVSAAGDWTRALIASTHAQHPHPPTKPQIQFWVKPHPHPGVLSLSTLYPRILILTTGSGIGPSLSSLLTRPPGQFARLVWSTRSPLATYGAEILALVKKADPDALVLDTDQGGRVDLVDVAWRVGRAEGVEAVFVLGNREVTRRVVGGLEGRGVVAFGPIWDS